ncbi:MAG: hypothetical protein JNL11_07450 [Bdellovibrionaceae bacterium]|nr:hypothetical protein [Pseudobdellovibrionaceae bacterium]
MFNLKNRNLRCVLIGLVLFFFVGCSQYSEPQGLSNPKVSPTSGNGNQKAESIAVEPNFDSIKTQILEKKCIGCHSPNGDKNTNKDAQDILFDTEAVLLRATSTAGPLIVPGEPQNSVFYQSLVSYESIRKRVKKMPPETSRHAALTGEEVLVVAAWISSLPKEVPIVNEEPPVTAPVVTQPVVTQPVETPPAVLDYAYIKSEILEKKCISCHKAEGKAEDLPFGTRDELLNLTNDVSESILVVGRPMNSLLYLSLLKDQDSRKGARIMPPKKAVTDGLIQDITPIETELIRKWIEDGAR